MLASRYIYTDSEKGRQRARKTERERQTEIYTERARETERLCNWYQMFTGYFLELGFEKTGQEGAVF